MNELYSDYYNFLNWLDRQNFGVYELLILIVLGVSVVAFFMALRAYRRAAHPKYAGRTKSLERKVHFQESRIGHEVDNFERERNRLITEYREVSSKCHLLEQKLNLVAKHLGLELDDELFPEVREAKENALAEEALSDKKKDLERTRASKTQKPAEESEESALLDGLSKTRTSFFSKLKDLFQGKSEISEDIYASLEEILITSDIGVKTSRKLLAELSKEVADFKNLDQGKLTSFLKNQISDILADERDPEIKAIKQDSGPLVLLIVGVNGVGKTTTIAKLSAKFKAQGARVLLGACDTFRAAAGEQLEHWASKIGVDIVQGADNAKPSTVAYQTIHRGIEEDFDVVIIDTAGRLHTKVNLMNELQSVVKIIEREQKGAPHESILVLDATTGQNALQQAREFSKVVGLTGIVVTKLDGTPKGGIVVAIKDELGIPIRYIGVGEGAGDLKVFSATEFAEGLLGINLEGGSGNDQTVSAKGQARRNRRALG